MAEFELPHGRINLAYGLGAYPNGYELLYKLGVKPHETFGIGALGRLNGNFTENKVPFDFFGGVQASFQLWDLFLEWKPKLPIDLTVMAGNFQPRRYILRSLASDNKLSLPASIIRWPNLSGDDATTSFGGTQIGGYVALTQRFALKTGDLSWGLNAYAGDGGKPVSWLNWNQPFNAEGKFTHVGNTQPGGVRYMGAARLAYTSASFQFGVQAGYGGHHEPGKPPGKDDQGKDVPGKDGPRWDQYHWAAGLAFLGKEAAFAVYADGGHSELVTHARHGMMGQVDIDGPSLKFSGAFTHEYLNTRKDILPDPQGSFELDGITFPSDPKVNNNNPPASGQGGMMMGSGPKFPCDPKINPKCGDSSDPAPAGQETDGIAVDPKEPAREARHRFALTFALDKAWDTEAYGKIALVASISGLLILEETGKRLGLGGALLLRF